MRKAALVLRELERELLADPAAAAAGGDRMRFAAGLAALFADEKESPEAVREAALQLAQAAGTEPSGLDLVRAVDRLRHCLLAATGQAPADWDLVDPTTGQPDPGTRRVFIGLKAYLEDLRSPFNVGSIFRTADAFGLEELILSPSCADPYHPRALRSAMGAVDLVPFRRTVLAEIDGELPIFALELGGDIIDSFDFPEQGIVVLGSEELGISREVRELCTYGTVSIPMFGAKASLNVAVAFGVLMHAWTSSIR
jgi:TrmH family RNA methyltransferase